VLERFVALGLVFCMVAALVIALWRLLSFDTTVVKGRGKPGEYLSDEEVEKLLSENGQGDEDR